MCLPSSAAFLMRASGPFVARLDILQKSHQLILSEPWPEQDLTHFPKHLWARHVGRMFFPMPAAASEGRHWSAGAW